MSTTTGKGGQLIPVLAVQVEGVDRSDLYSSLGGVFPPEFVPLVGLKLMFAEALARVAPGLRPPAYFITTNSSGEGQTQLPDGNYTAQALNGYFEYTGNVSVMGSLTRLRLQVLPEAANASSVAALNQDTPSGLEPSSTVYAEVEGNLSFAPDSPCVLIGLNSMGTSPNATGPLEIDVTLVDTINGTVKATYGSPLGTWVAISPSGSYQSIPTSGTFLLRYETNATVSYGAS